VVPTESLTNRAWLAGVDQNVEGPGSWFLDMKYQTCFLFITPEGFTTMVAN